MKMMLACSAISLLVLVSTGCGGSACKLQSRAMSGTMGGSPLVFVPPAAARVGYLDPARIGLALFTQPLITDNTQCDATKGGIDKATSALVIIQWDGTALQTGTRDVDVSFCRKPGDCGAKQPGQLRIDIVSPEFLECTACSDGDDSISGVFQAVNCVK